MSSLAPEHSPVSAPAPEHSLVSASAPEHSTVSASALGHSFVFTQIIKHSPESTPTQESTPSTEFQLKPAPVLELGSEFCGHSAAKSNGHSATKPRNLIASGSRDPRIPITLVCAVCDDYCHLVRLGHAHFCSSSQDGDVRL